MPFQTKITKYWKKPAYTIKGPAKRRRRVFRRKRRNQVTRYVKPINRLRGTAKMPYFKLSRCYEGALQVLSTATHIHSGFWRHPLQVTFNAIPNAATLAGLYRFFRLKKVLVQYTPNTRSDEYCKMFPYPDGGGAATQPLYTSKGGTLEIKMLNYDGYLTLPNFWDECLNRAGKLQKCATTKPFRRTCYPTIQAVLEDATTGVDTTKVTRAPWLSTDNPNNLNIIHYLGIDIFHTLNHVSYDVSYPLTINTRYVVEVEFKGLKI